jgi:hypothetical protein
VGGRPSVDDRNEGGFYRLPVRIRASMASKRLGPNAVVESCPRCDDETPHDVRVEIRTESTAEENAAFSREPYRIATCRECGSETEIRMNDA